MNHCRLIVTILVIASASLSACASHHDRDEKVRKSKTDDLKNPPKTQLSEAELRAEANQLYLRAHKLLEQGEYSTAITQFDNLITRYPFTDYGTQAEMEKVFAQYKSQQTDDALESADHFLRDHPRHPQADYVQYLHGLINFSKNQSVLNLFSSDNIHRDVGGDLSAFSDFNLLVQKYPRSIYIGDARLRMIYLRDHIARHELTVARFYMHRAAYLAAAKRSEEIIGNYPGAPATADALKLMAEAYRKLGLDSQAQNAQLLIAANPQLGKTDRPVNTSIDRKLSDAPPAALASSAEPAPLGAPDAPPAPEQGHDIFSKFAGLFSFLDTTRPENQHTFVIPTGNAPPAPSAQGAGTTAAANPAVSNTHGLQIGVGPDEADKWKPDSKTASTAGSTPTASVAAPAATPVPPPATPKTSPQPPQSAQPPSTAAPQPGFFARFFTGFANLFSFLDPDRSKPATPSPATPSP